VSEASYPPQTVALVALGSLIAGFVIVFGGGMILLRPRSHETNHTVTISSLPSTTQTPSTERAAPAVPIVNQLAPSAEDHRAPEPNSSQEASATVLAPTAAASSTPAAGSVTVGSVTIARCFDAGPPTPIAGAQCGQLAALQQHIASKSSALAQCARGDHGRLALVLDFRFSTSFVRGWGSPASTVPRAGDVTACVKQAILPLPFASIPHDHDRYIVTVPIDF
jgi:hypothetical protein